MREGGNFSHLQVWFLVVFIPYEFGNQQSFSKTSTQVLAPQGEIRDLGDLAAGCIFAPTALRRLASILFRHKQNWLSLPMPSLKGIGTRASSPSKDSQRSQKSSSSRDSSRKKKTKKKASKETSSQILDVLEEDGAGEAADAAATEPSSSSSEATALAAEPLTIAAAQETIPVTIAAEPKKAPAEELAADITATAPLSQYIPKDMAYYKPSWHRMLWTGHIQHAPALHLVEIC